MQVSTDGGTGETAGRRERVAVIVNTDDGATTMDNK